MRMLRRGVLIALILVFATGLLRAEYPGFGDRRASPEVAEVLTRWVEALGGERRLRALWRAEIKATIAIGKGGEPLVSTARVFPLGRFNEVTRQPGGDIVTGFDGSVGWQQIGQRGFALLSARDATVIARECDLQKALRVLGWASEIRRLPDRTDEDGTLRVLELKDQNGENEVWLFGESTGLRVRREYTNKTGVKTTVRFADFRKIDGLIEPFRIEIQGEANDVLIQRSSVVFNPMFDEEMCAASERELADYRKTEAVLQRHVAAINGGQAAEKQSGRIVLSAVEIPTSGLKYGVKMSLNGRGKVLLDQDVPGFGRLLMGYDGKVGWAWSEMQGYRELQGAELVQLMGAGDIRGPLGAIDRVPVRKYLGERIEGGRRLIAMELGSMTASEGTFFFDPDTGLLARVDSMLATGPGGVLHVVIEVGDYREVDGAKLPFLTTVTNPAVKILTRIESVENNVDLPDALFAPRKEG